MRPQTSKKPAWNYATSSSVDQGVDWKDPAAQRARLIRLKILDFEVARSLLKPGEKWPTTKAVKNYRGKSAASDSTSIREIPAIPDSAFPFSIPTPPSNSSFSRFPALPVELRLQIWEWAACMPKFIEVRHFSIPYDDPFVSWGNQHSLSQTCRESREIALNYTAKNPSTACICRYSSHDHGAVKFNPSLDTIFFRPLLSSNPLDNIAWQDFSGLHTIQHLAIPFRERAHFAPNVGASLRHILYPFTALKTITLVLGCVEKSWTRNESIELRSLEQWFADGRERGIHIPGWKTIDVRELADYMGWDWKNGHGPRLKVEIKVRIVAWKSASRGREHTKSKLP